MRTIESSTSLKGRRLHRLSSWNGPRRQRMEAVWAGVRKVELRSKSVTFHASLRSRLNKSSRSSAARRAAGRQPRRCLDLRLYEILTKSRHILKELYTPQLDTWHLEQVRKITNKVSPERNWVSSIHGYGETIPSASNANKCNRINASTKNISLRVASQRLPMS